ncbi:MAG: nicotinate (nicotinamide) nucleotide adenylyltransferase [Mariniphaga sp.]
MKIAIFSGSFNPIHNGHLAIAREVLKQKVADELWFLVSPQNPLKKNRDLMDEKMRMKMVELAIEDEPGFRVSDFELHLPRPSYTIHTLENLKINYPEHQFVLLIGGDNLKILHKWFEYRRILDEFGLIVYPRPGYINQEDSLFLNTTFVTAPLINISATEIRKKLNKGETISGMVPEKVALFLQNSTL